MGWEVEGRSKFIELVWLSPTRMIKVFKNLWFIILLNLLSSSSYFLFKLRLGVVCHYYRALVKVQWLLSEIDHSRESFLGS